MRKHKPNPNYKYSVVYCFDTSRICYGTYDSHDEAMAAYRTSSALYHGNHINFSGVIKHTAGAIPWDRVLPLASANKNKS